jgi:hypothetical protein
VRGAVHADRLIGRQASSRRRFPPELKSVIAPAFLLGLVALMALKLWILARMLIAYFS